MNMSRLKDGRSESEEPTLTSQTEESLGSISSSRSNETIRTSEMPASYRLRREEEGGGVDIEFTVNFRKRSVSDDSEPKETMTTVTFGCPEPTLAPTEIWLNGVKVYQDQKVERDPTMSSLIPAQTGNRSFNEHKDLAPATS
ncbi:hypothetical protein AB6A40_002083 [Gnathostoma spinigerum]|uniref:Uncharacterized protein n=1 Tax=Gnathostoma spinigerum TaxID=75299 RepID=A0ABD6E5Q7_9BILA